MTHHLVVNVQITVLVPYHLIQVIATHLDNDAQVSGSYSNNVIGYTYNGASIGHQGPLFIMDVISYPC